MVFSESCPIASPELSRMKLGGLAGRRGLVVEDLSGEDRKNVFLQVSLISQLPQVVAQVVLFTRTTWLPVLLLTV